MRSVRFRSVNEEFSYEEATPDNALPQGSNIFEQVMKDINISDETDLDINDDVFLECNATSGERSKRSDIKKHLKPRKSILKRRLSSSKR